MTGDRSTFVVVVAMATWACAGCAPNTSSSVTIGEYGLTPRSALFFDGSKYGVSSVVMLSDQQDICGYFQGGQCSMQPPGPPTGNFIAIAFEGAPHVADYEATDACLNFDSSGRCKAQPPLAPAFAVLPQGKAQLTFGSNPCTADGRCPASGNELTRFSATSGTVSINGVSTTDVYGRYAVTLNTGLSLSGTFTAPACARLELVADFVPLCTQEQPQADTVKTTCSCESRTTVAECVTSMCGSARCDLCTCTSISGAKSSCAGFFADAYRCCGSGVLPDGGKY